MSFSHISHPEINLKFLLEQTNPQDGQRNSCKQEAAGWEGAAHIFTRKLLHFVLFVFLFVHIQSCVILHTFPPDHSQ